MDERFGNDEELIARVSQGSEPALMELYQRYARAAFSLAYYVVHDQGLAEEVVQDVFVNLWQKARQYAPERGKPSAWLLNIARNRAIDVLRHQRRQVPVTQSLDDLPQEQPDRELPPDHPHRELHLLLQELPPEQARVIELAYFQGFTHEEIARELGLPAGTVKSRILLGLHKLREIIK